MGCCLVAFASWLSPRLALFLMWVLKLGDDRLSVAFNSFLIGFLGFLFLPWTALAYAICFAPGVPHGVNGFGWFVVGFAFIVDLMSYTSGDRARRRRNVYVEG
jgi:hypothetical protein